MRRRSMCWDTNHIVLPLHSSVVVYYLDIYRALSRPLKTDAILIVDPNAMLASSIAFECLQLVSTRYAKVTQQKDRVKMVKLTPRNITHLSGHDRRAAAVFRPLNRSAAPPSANDLITF
jgi:hypothetical protein